MYTRKRFLLIIFLILILLGGFYCSKANESTTDTKNRPSEWAQPITLPGLPNLYKVSDNLYRGAQPEKNGILELKKLGIKTIISLRKSNDTAEFVKDSGITYYHIPVFTLFPSKEKYKQFLKIVSNPSNWPVFVHCQHGADRTGSAVALYRIKIQKWNKEDAINEMVNGGYHFHKIHSHLKNFVRNF